MELVFLVAIGMATHDPKWDIGFDGQEAKGVGLDERWVMPSVTAPFRIIINPPSPDRY